MVSCLLPSLHAHCLFLFSVFGVFCLLWQGDVEATMTRDEVFRRLVTLGIGLNVTFVLWGVLQVRTVGGA